MTRTAFSVTEIAQGLGANCPLLLSTSSPEFIGGCQVKGTELPEGVIAVLDNSAGLNARDGAKAKTLLKATAVWKMNEHHERFEPLSTDNLGCPLGSVVTSDGGP